MVKRRLKAKKSIGSEERLDPWVAKLVSFRFINNNDEGGFFDGMEPDYTACDNLSEPFGSSDEDLFAAAIEYIKTGTAPDCDIISKSLFSVAQMVSHPPIILETRV